MEACSCGAAAVMSSVNFILPHFISQEWRLVLMIIILVIIWEMIVQVIRRSRQHRRCFQTSMIFGSRVVKVPVATVLRTPKLVQEVDDLEEMATLS